MRKTSRYSVGAEDRSLFAGIGLEDCHSLLQALQGVSSMSPLSAHRFAQARRLIATFSAIALLAGCGVGKINYVHADRACDARSMSHIPYTGPLSAEVSAN